MPTTHGHSVIPTAAFIDSLKFLQKYPEQFPLDLRAKFCGCTGSKGTSSVCSEYSKQTKLKKVIPQKSGEFISIANEANNNLNKFESQARSNDSRISSNNKKKSMNQTYQDVDVMRTINFLITNPEKIPVNAVNRLCKITANLSLPQSKSKRTLHDQDSTTASGTLHSGSNTKRKNSGETKRNDHKSSKIHKKQLSTKTSLFRGSRRVPKRCHTYTERLPNAIRKHMNILKTVATSKSISHKRVGSNASISIITSSTRHSKTKNREYSRSKKKHHSMGSLSTERSHFKKYRSKNERTRSRSSFRSKRKSVRRFKKPSPKKHTSDPKVFSKTNEEQILSNPVIQPAFAREKITKHQPIPFVIFRLCCPPGMIPLTGKVAERLGLNTKMANQQSPNQPNGIFYSM